jgi:hypothetical protein
MQNTDDSFLAWVDAGSECRSEFKALEGLPVTPRSASLAFAPNPVVGKLQGFDLLEQPQVTHVSCAPGQVILCRSAVVLKRSMLGRDVLLVFEDGDITRPIITGVLEAHRLSNNETSPRTLTVESDGERHVIEAEQEIVLRCGDASITLTRAGKVLIKGSYILSRATGYNKIKGAAIDIN